MIKKSNNLIRAKLRQCGDYYRGFLYSIFCILKISLFNWRMITLNTVMVCHTSASPHPANLPPPSPHPTHLGLSQWNDYGGYI